MQTISNSNVSIEKPAPVFITLEFKGDVGYTNTRCGLFVKGEEVEFSTDTEYDMAGICIGRYIEKNFQKELLTLNYDECVYADKLKTDEGEKVLVYGAYGMYAMGGLLLELGYSLKRISKHRVNGNETIVYALEKF